MSKRGRRFFNKRRGGHRGGGGGGGSNFRSKEFRYGEQLLEIDVGITQFITETEGFPGIIKARFSDFQVNEIDEDGTIVRLTDTAIPKDFNEKKISAEKLSEKIESPCEKIPQDTWESMKALVKSEDLSSTVTLDATNLSKEDRGQVHACVKQAFGKLIYATTINKDDQKVMEFKKQGEGKDHRFKWPEDKGEYVHFLVYKENLDTLEATLKIASCVRMAPASFNYAGVKDKRAKTTQRFSVRKVQPWKLIDRTRTLYNIKIGNITFKDCPLKLGQLKGNQFRIALRNVVAEDEVIERSLQSVKEQGFINYYGLQRFGNDKEAPTFSIGMQLLLGNWKEACELILKPTKSDDPDSDICKAKRLYFETKDASKSLEQFFDNKGRCIEHLLLAGLSKGHSNDFVNALECIPRNTRLLYIHSFQSLIWNQMASKRIELFGLKAVEGDLVLSDEPMEMEDAEDHDKTQVQDKCEDEPSTEMIIKNNVKILTAEDCGNYTIYNVVLPLPGYDIIYPENMKRYYQESLESFGLTLEMPKQKVKTYTLSGTYRKLLSQVQDFSWKIMRYNEPHDNLILSDVEKLKGFREPVNICGGKYKALILEFSLSSSSYATMVLREILKTDTSSGSHAKLNDYFKDKVSTNKSTDDNENFNQGGLLNNAVKFEQFKNLVFNVSEENTKKRKIDEVEDSAEVENAVKAANGGDSQN